MKKARTLRRLPPETRKLAKILNDMELATTRLKRQLDKLASMEADNRAWQIRQAHYQGKGEVDPLTLDPMTRSILQKVTQRLPH